MASDKTAGHYQEKVRIRPLPVSVAWRLPLVSDKGADRPRGSGLLPLDAHFPGLNPESKLRVNGLCSRQGCLRRGLGTDVVKHPGGRAPGDTDAEVTMTSATFRQAGGR